ncbi:MAG: hypothetical protein EAX96_06460 [Candidatus Lokiarchaeota archaeon]|nr:hypothetical protein [Candidatus Lokiarchaeota archaeon]
MKENKLVYYINKISNIIADIENLKYDIFDEDFEEFKDILNHVHDRVFNVINCFTSEIDDEKQKEGKLIEEEINNININGGSKEKLILEISKDISEYIKPILTKITKNLSLLIKETLKTIPKELMGQFEIIPTIYYPEVTIRSR